MRYGCQHSYDPAQGGYQGCSLEIREGEHIEWSADSQVPLQREREDRQHVGIGGTEIVHIILCTMYVVICKN